MNGDTPTDEQLMTQFYGCDEEAFDGTLTGQTSLYGRHNTRLFNYAKKRFKDGGVPNEGIVADTALNRTWMRVFQTKDRPSSRWKEEKGPFKPWLHKILWNECARAATAERKRSPIEETIETPTITRARIMREEESKPASGAPANPHTTSRLANTIPNEIDDDVMDRLQSCIDALTDGQRKVFNMKHDDGMRQVDIAELLGIGEPAIANRLKAARESLQQCLKLYGIGPSDLN